MAAAWAENGHFTKRLRHRRRRLDGDIRCPRTMIKMLWEFQGWLKLEQVAFVVGDTTFRLGEGNLSAPFQRSAGSPVRECAAHPAALQGS